MLKSELQNLYENVSEYVVQLIKLKSSKHTAQIIDSVRRYHSKNFFEGVKRIGSFQNKTSLAIEFCDNYENGSK